MFAGPSDFEKELTHLFEVYQQLNDDEKVKLEEAVQMVLTKFKERLK